MAAMNGGGSHALAAAALDAVVQQKKLLRTTMRRRLRALLPDLRTVEDDAIQKRVLGASWFRNCRLLCAYISCPALKEVDTSQLLATILQPHPSEVPKRLFVPRVQDKAAHMSMLRITNTTNDVVANSMNILEPTVLDSAGNPREDVMGSSEPLQLLLLPGLAFDHTGRRLGRGGGYYDVFLRNYLLLARDKGWKPPLLVALAYSVQLLDEPVPVDDTDVPVDAVVTSDGVYTFNDRLRTTEYGTA